MKILLINVLNIFIMKIKWFVGLEKWKQAKSYSYIHIERQSSSSFQIPYGM